MNLSVQLDCLQAVLIIIKIVPSITCGLYRVLKCSGYDQAIIDLLVQKIIVILMETLLLELLYDNSMISSNQ